MSREDQAAVYAQKYGFNLSFYKVRYDNPSSDLPYHNWFHTCCMICNCMQGADYYNLSWVEHHLLGLAALYHDYDHSGGTESDTMNVRRAIHAFYTDCPRDLTSLQTKQVEACIAVTEYPFVTEPCTIEQKIIRDADLLQILELEWYEHVVLGLRAEFKVGGKDYSIKDMLQGQLNFLNEYVPNKLYTEWAKELVEKDCILKHRLGEIFLKIVNEVKNAT